MFVPGHQCERPQLLMVEDSPQPNIDGDSMQELEMEIQEVMLESFSMQYLEPTIYK